MAGDWQQVGENLVKHRTGTIYLRASVGGKVKRVSLGTKSLRIAKLKRDERLNILRNAAGGSTGKPATVGNVIEALKRQVTSQPHLRPRSVEYYEEMFSILALTLPVTWPVATWTAAHAGEWWQATAARYASQRANNLLGMAKRLGKLMLSRGLVADNPTANLKRVPIVAGERAIPSRDEIDLILADIRRQKKANSEQAANFVEFLAFAGCRVSQARAFRWEHIDVDWITFHGGVEGTKGGKERRLPITAPLAALLGRMMSARSKGPLFAMKRPHEALANACERLKIPHVRIHDLRHFFATHALRSGVDVQTVSKWLGHKDGGVLVLKTYGHLCDSHSLASAGKIS